MKRNKNELLVADMFCGAGGTSTGAERAIKELGKKMVVQVYCVLEMTVVLGRIPLRENQEQAEIIILP